MTLHYLHQLDQSLIRPARCVFVEPTDTGGERASADARTKAREQIIRTTTEAAATTKFDELKDVGVLKEEDRAEILQAWRTAHPEQTSGEMAAQQPANENAEALSRKFQTDIEKIHNIDKQALAKKLKEQVDRKFINNVKQLRNAVRNELVELGIEKDRQDIAKIETAPIGSQKTGNERIRIRSVRSLQKDIGGLVASLIDEDEGGRNRQQRSLKQDIRVTDRMQQRCHQLVERVFDGGRDQFIAFLGVLEDQGIPPDQQGQAVDLDFIRLLRNFGRYIAPLPQPLDTEAIDDFFGHAIIDHPEPFLQKLENISGIYTAFAEAEPTHHSKLLDQLTDLRQRAAGLKDAVDTYAARLGDDVALRLIYDSASHTNVLATIDQMIAKNTSPQATDQQRKFAQALINKLGKDFDAADHQIAVIQQTIEEEKKRREEERRRAAGEDAKEKKQPTEQPKPEELKEGARMESKEEKQSLLGAVKSAIGKTVTINGKVTWYSWSDIVTDWNDFWALIKTDREEKQGDRTGTLKTAAANLYGGDVARNNAEKFGDWVMKEANERYKRYEYWSKDEILGALKKATIGAAKVGMAMALAKRGMLRWSDRAVVKTLCEVGGITPPSEDEWKHAYKNLDQTKIREKLIEAGNGIGMQPRIRFGETLLATQASAEGDLENKGERIASSAEAASPAAEFRRLWTTLKDSGHEGDARVVGFMKEMLKRGNMNGGKCNLKVDNMKVDGAISEHTFTSLDIGNVALLIIDQYLQHRITDEVLMRLASVGDSQLAVFSVLKPMLVKKFEKNGKFASQLEHWGWISETGGITPRGLVELPRFFNTRNATALESGVETIVHIGNTQDAGAYVAKSSNRTPSDIRSDKRGGKILSYDVKATDVKQIKEIFRGVTTDQNTDSERLMSIIKSGIEDFMDGAQQAFQDGGALERYSNGSAILTREKFAELESYDPDAAARFEPIGLKRMQRGRAILQTVLAEEGGTSLLQENAAYTLADGILDKTSQKGRLNQPLTLEDFIAVAVDGTAEYATNYFHNPKGCQRIATEAAQIKQAFRTYATKTESRSKQGKGKQQQQAIG